MTTGSQDLGLFNVSSERRHLLHHSVPITALGNWALFDQREDRPLLANQHHFQQLGFFQEVYHPHTNQAHTCLASAIWQEQGS